ncbi:MAG: motility protein A [Clostridia bacterium]
MQSEHNIDKSTLIGIISGILLLIIGIMIQGSIGSFFDASSVFIVIGGTFAACFASYPINTLKNSTKVIKNAFIEKQYDTNVAIEQIGELSITAKKNGLLALEKVARDLNNPFLEKSALLVVDGMDPDVIKEILDMDLENMARRHEEGEGILKTLGKYAPAFGMIGTLIGLITMLQQLENPETLGPAMAVALITTFYGAVLANMIFLPLAGKLKFKSDQEVKYKMMIIEGIISVQAGDAPMMIKEKLQTFMETQKREE